MLFANFPYRSYKNGFVWHDICEDDLILPAQGSEYVLKGSELFEECHSGKQELGFIVSSNFKLIFFFLFLHNLSTG